MTGLLDLYLAKNQLSGSIPEAWCGLVAPANSASILSVIQPQENSAMCGAVPDCLAGGDQPIVAPSVTLGTWLMHPSNPDSVGCCKLQPVNV